MVVPLSGSPDRRRLRSRRTLAAALLVILVAAGAVALVERSASQPSSGTPMTKEWLDQAIARWKPSQNASVAFGATFTRASYGNPQQSYNSIEVQDADLNMLLSTNAQCIRIDLGYAPWLQNDAAAVAGVSGLIRDIKDQGRCLVIADASSESYRGAGALPWTQFQAAWIDRVRALAAAFQPDYYLVIKEPGWYVPMVSDARTNPDFMNLTDWVDLTQSLSSAVLSASPATKVGVSIAADSLGKNPAGYTPYLESIEKLSGISFLGFDVYDPTGFAATEGFLAQHGAGGKQVWLAEAWSADGPTIYNASRSQLDVEWMRALYYFAQHVQATMVIPFYTDLFSSYGLTGKSPTDPAQIISLYSERTPVFYEFQKLSTSQ